MSGERDTQAIHLRAGDRVRYVGEWLDIVKVSAAIDWPRSVDKPRPIVVFDCETDEGPDRQVFFVLGHFVAADVMPRADEIPVSREVLADIEAGRP